MKALVTDIMIAAFISSFAGMLIPEDEIKSGAEKLISFAALAAALLPAVKWLTCLLKGGK